MSMGDVGLHASKYFLNSNSLRQFNSALKQLKRSNSSKFGPEAESEVRNMLGVLETLSEAMDGRIASRMSLDAQGIVEILNNKHAEDWQRYKATVASVKAKLEAGIPMTALDIEVLEDIADALDMECGILFRRISGK